MNTRWMLKRFSHFLSVLATSALVSMPIPMLSQMTSTWTGGAGNWQPCRSRTGLLCGTRVRTIPPLGQAVQQNSKQELRVGNWTEPAACEFPKASTSQPHMTTRAGQRLARLTGDRRTGSQITQTSC
jgi:hypothetical protein